MASTTLIVGSDAKVGSALASRLRRAGRRVVGTTRQQDNVDGSTLYLDLSDDVKGWRYPSDVEVAVICAGVSSVMACAREPGGSAQVNVHGTAELAQGLVSRGAFVVFLSSGHVFDGSRPHRRADEPFGPITEYGMQKAEAERQLNQYGDSAAIVRLSNIVGLNDPLFTGWAQSLRKGEAFHPFQDMTLAPVPLSCVVSALQIITEAKLPGVWQVSGERDVSYAEIARMGARLLGASQGLVQPIRAAEAGYSERIRDHTTLSIDRIELELGIQPPDVTWTLETAFTNPRALAGV
jgi:dTDP-4-dehydrorhamnose reductase